MIKNKFIYYAIFFETIAITSFFLYSNIFNVYHYIVFHLLASFFISLVLAPFFSLKFKKQKKKIILVLTTFIFITSLIGLILPILFLIFFKKKIEKMPQVDILEFEQTGKYIPTVKRKLGESSLINFNKNAPENIKVDILSLQKRLNFKNKGRILKEALSDSNDEIRLLAFSIISKEEDIINKKIFELKERQKNVNSENEKADIYKNLGSLYWESIFLGIVDEELKNYFLKLTKEYFDKALKIKDDYQIYLYLGRIFLIENNFEMAEKFLSKAYTVSQNNKILSYLIEIKYNKRDFKDVLEMSKNLDLCSIHPNFYFIYKTWVNDEE